MLNVFYFSKFYRSRVVMPINEASFVSHPRDTSLVGVTKHENSLQHHKAGLTTCIL